MTSVDSIIFQQGLVMSRSMTVQVSSMSILCMMLTASKVYKDLAKEIVER